MDPKQSIIIEGLSQFDLDSNPQHPPRQSIIFVVSPEFAVTGSICREGRKAGQLSSPTALVSDTYLTVDSSLNGDDDDGDCVIGDDDDDRSETDEGDWLWPTVATIGFRSVKSFCKLELKEF